MSKAVRSDVQWQNDEEFVHWHDAFMVARGWDTTDLDSDSLLLYAVWPQIQAALRVIAESDSRHESRAMYELRIALRNLK